MNEDSIVNFEELADYYYYYITVRGHDRQIRSPLDRSVSATWTGY